MYRALTYISIASGFVPLIICFTKLKTLDRKSRVLFIYFIISAITEILSLPLASSYINYFYLQNSFVLIEFFLFAFVYYLDFDSIFLKKIIRYFVLFYFLASLAVFLFYKPFSQSNNITSIFEAWILMSFSIFFFYKIQSELAIPKLSDYPPFWYNCGILIYFCTSLILFLFNDFIENCSRRTFENLWSLHLVANTAFNILMAIGIWKNRSK